MMDIAVSILFLAIMEGILSFDNALALAAMVKHLPHKDQKNALRFGMVGAFIFRSIALLFITMLVNNPIFKYIGAGYLLWLTLSFFIKRPDNSADSEVHSTKTFWRTVVAVELTDIAFSIDSIVVAAGVSDKFWILLTGGIIGILMMRFASSIFVRLMDVFPKLERSAYFLVGIVGIKLLLEVTGVVTDFHTTGSKAQIISGILMVISLLSGFTVRRRVPLCVD